MLGPGLRNKQVVTRVVWGSEIHSDQTPHLQEGEGTGCPGKGRAADRRQQATIPAESMRSPLYFICKTRNGSRGPLALRPEAWRLDLAEGTYCMAWTWFGIPLGFPVSNLLSIKKYEKYGN